MSLCYPNLKAIAHCFSPCLLKLITLAVRSGGTNGVDILRLYDSSSKKRKIEWASEEVSLELRAVFIYLILIHEEFEIL